MRLQYEVFPQDTAQATRLVFLVRDLEIRDRLAQSNINKFLYQYTTETMPRQSHANMVSQWRLTCMSRAFKKYHLLHFIYNFVNVLLPTGVSEGADY